MKINGIYLMGCWLLVIGCWLLVIGCWLLVIGCWLLAVRRENRLWAFTFKPTTDNR